MATISKGATMPLSELTYEQELDNEAHEKINLKLEVWGTDKRPQLELEVEGYSGKHGSSPRMYVTLTLDEFDIIAEQVKNYRKMLEVANG